MEIEESFDSRFPHLFDVAMQPAMRILRSVPDAEDVAAEALARTLADWKRLGQAPWIDAWLVRVATNLAIDQVRRASRRLPRVHVADDGELEVRLDLASAVASLPRRQREAVSLRYFGDLPERDVAALMDVSIGSVKTHLHRGLATLRQQLGEAWRAGLPEVPGC